MQKIDTSIVSEYCQRRNIDIDNIEIEQHLFGWEPFSEYDTTSPIKGEFDSWDEFAERMESMGVGRFIKEYFCLPDDELDQKVCFLFFLDFRAIHHGKVEKSVKLKKWLKRNVRQWGSGVYFPCVAFSDAMMG